MRKKPGRRKRVARKRRKRGIVWTSIGGETLKLGSKKFITFLSRNLLFNHKPVVDAEMMAKSCAREHP